MYPIILDATTKTVQAVMSGAAATTNPDFSSHYADSTSSTFTEGEQDGALNGTTPVTLVSAPASSTRRVVKQIIIQNKDTANVIITVSYNNNSTLRQIAVFTLAPGETWSLLGSFSTSGQQKIGADMYLGNVQTVTGAKQFTAASFLEFVAGNSGTTKTITWNNGNKQKITLTGNCTFTFTAPTYTSVLVLRCVGDGTARTVVWPGTVKWPGASATTVMTGTAGVSDLITFYYDGTNYNAVANQNFS